MVTTEPAYWFPASVTIGDTVSFAVKVKNNQPTLFADSLDIYVAVDTGSIFQSLVVIHIQSSSTDSIPGNDTIIKAINDVPIDGQVFMEGNNTVVIWPIYPNPGGPTADTMVNNVYAYLGVGEEEELFIYPAPYPNPAADWIEFKQLTKPIEEVRIFNAAGMEIQVLKKVEKINVRPLLPGVYYLQYEHKGRLIISRFIKS
jgi:hypothetical protein